MLGYTKIDYTKLGRVEIDCNKLKCVKRNYNKLEIWGYLGIRISQKF